jgi:hypothetical protein
MVHLFNLIISHPPFLKSFTRSRTVYALRPSKPAGAKARNKLTINNLTPPQHPIHGELQAFCRRPSSLFVYHQLPSKPYPHAPMPSSKTYPRHLVTLSRGINGNKSSILRPLKINHLHQCSPPQKVFVKSLPFLGGAAFKAYLCASLNGEAISLAFGFNILS